MEAFHISKLICYTARKSTFICFIVREPNDRGHCLCGVWTTILVINKEGKPSVFTHIFYKVNSLSLFEITSGWENINDKSKVQSTTIGTADQDSAKDARRHDPACHIHQFPTYKLILDHKSEIYYYFAIQ